jgi:hypothetical protein
MIPDEEPFSGAAQLNWLNEWTLVLHWSGSGNFQTVSNALIQVRAELKVRPLRYLVCDTLDVIDFDPSLRSPADALLKEAKGRGMKELIVVARLPALRMLAFGLGMVAGARTRVFLSRAEAEAYCNGRDSTSDATRA